MVNKYKVKMCLNISNDTDILKLCKNINFELFSTKFKLSEFIPEVINNKLYLYCEGSEDNNYVRILNDNNIHNTYNLIILNNYNIDLFKALISTNGDDNAINHGELYKDINGNYKINSTITFIEKNCKCSIDEVFNYFKYDNKNNKNYNLNYKIIGYKFIKKYPLCDSKLILGKTYYIIDKYINDNLHYSKSPNITIVNITAKIAHKYPENFEPIYEKIDEIEYILNNDDKTIVKIKNNSIIYETDTIDIKLLEILYNKIISLPVIVAGHKTIVNTFDIGCQKKLKVDDIKNILDIHKEYFNI